jgi:hypothetical protein
MGYSGGWEGFSTAWHCQITAKTLPPAMWMLVYFPSLLIGRQAVPGAADTLPRRAPRAVFDTASLATATTTLPRAATKKLCPSVVPFGGRPTGSPPSAVTTPACGANALTQLLSVKRQAAQGNSIAPNTLPKLRTTTSRAGASARDGGYSR